LAAIVVGFGPGRTGARASTPIASVAPAISQPCRWGSGCCIGEQESDQEAVNGCR
jgi:hypothetical protein